MSVVGGAIVLMMAVRRSLSAGSVRSFWLHLRRRMSGLKSGAPVVRGPDSMGAIWSGGSRRRS